MIERRNQSVPNRHILKNLPVHTFESFSREESSFNIMSFNEMGSLARTPLPHRHSFYEIIYIKHGEGAHVIDFEAYPIKPESIYLFSPDQIHFWELTGPLEGKSIKFSENFLLFSPSEHTLIDNLDFFHNVEYPPNLTLEQTQAKNINHLFNRIEEEYQSEAHARYLKILSYLIILLVDIQRIFMMGDNKKSVMKSSTLINLFKKMVSNEFLTHRSVAFYAGKLKVSEAHLYDLVKQNTGLTPGQIIRKEIALEAKRQLAHTENTISEIGYNLNFDDPSYFGRFFKRETGFSPNYFREHIREKYQFLSD
jgi:AraC family transcriptional regulator, transcriptional activator of pobA